MGQNFSKSTPPRSYDVLRTDQQVRILMAIAESCEPMLIRHLEIGAQVETDKDAEKAASSTFALAHQRIRDFIDDQARWATTDTSLDKYNEKITASNVNINAESLKNLEMLRRPSRIYGARVGKFMDPKSQASVWLAWFGSDLPIEGGLVGGGMSAEAALDDFDKKFRAELPANPPAEEPPAPPVAEKKPRKKK